MASSLLSVLRVLDTRLASPQFLGIVNNKLHHVKNNRKPVEKLFLLPSRDFRVAQTNRSTETPTELRDRAPCPKPEGLDDSSFEASSWQESCEESVDGAEEQPNHDIYQQNYSEDDVRLGILEAALELVPTHGWTKEAIVAAAESYGYPGVAHGMFPGGGADLANYFYSKCNSQLKTELQAEADEREANNTDRGSTTVFIREALKRRLQMTLEVKDTWPEAMAAMMNPEGIPTALKNLAQVADDVWFFAGDTSSDTNWYTKRGLLAAVYKSTELFMLQDKSEDHEATWKFLEHRLDGAVAAGTAFRQQRQTAESVLQSVVGAAGTAANILGLNAKK